MPLSWYILYLDQKKQEEEKVDNSVAIGLVEIGQKEWKKGDRHRVYVSIKTVLDNTPGLSFTLYPSGYWGESEYEGKPLDNARANDMLIDCDNIYYDANKAEWVNGKTGLKLDDGDSHYGRLVRLGLKELEKRALAMARKSEEKDSLKPMISEADLPESRVTEEELEKYREKFHSLNREYYEGWEASEKTDMAVFTLRVRREFPENIYDLYPNDRIKNPKLVHFIYKLWSPRIGGEILKQVKIK